MFSTTCQQCGKVFKVTAREEQMMEVVSALPPAKCPGCRKQEIKLEEVAVIYT